MPRLKERCAAKVKIVEWGSEKVARPAREEAATEAAEGGKRGGVKGRRRRRTPAYVGSNSTIQLANFEGLVLGCIKAKFYK